MKKTIKTFLLVALSATLMLGMSLVYGLEVKASSDSKWAAARLDLGHTSDGIEVYVSATQHQLTYKIPAGYTGKVNINAVEDARELIGGTYAPGQTAAFSVKIINESGIDYEYVPSSFNASTVDLSTYDSNQTQIPGAVGFDGNELSQEYSIVRTANTAIKALYATDAPTNEMGSDAILGPQLQARGYSGNDELCKYYLDFYNGREGTNVTKLEDFSCDIISEILSGSRLGTNKETCIEVTELGYNFFYNHCFSVIPEGRNLMDYEDTTYALASYMRGDSPYDAVINEAIGVIGDDIQGYVLPSLRLNMNGNYTTNAFQAMKFTFVFGLQLQPVQNTTGRLMIEKYDGDGHLITTSNACFYLYQIDTDNEKVYYNESSMVRDRQLASNIETEEGIAAISELETGTYYIEETKAPIGYILGSEATEVEVLADEMTVAKVTNIKNMALEVGENKNTEDENTKEALVGGSNKILPNTNNKQVAILFLGALTLALGLTMIGLNKKHLSKK